MSEPKFHTGLSYGNNALLSRGECALSTPPPSTSSTHRYGDNSHQFDCFHALAVSKGYEMQYRRDQVPCRRSDEPHHAYAADPLSRNDLYVNIGDPKSLHSIFNQHGIKQLRNPRRTTNALESTGPIFDRTALSPRWDLHFEIVHKCVKRGEQPTSDFVSKANLAQLVNTRKGKAPSKRSRIPFDAFARGTELSLPLGDDQIQVPFYTLRKEPPTIVLLPSRILFRAISPKSHATNALDLIRCRTGHPRALGYAARSTARPLHPKREGIQPCRESPERFVTKTHARANRAL